MVRAKTERKKRVAIKIQAKKRDDALTVDVIDEDKKHTFQGC